MSSFQDYLASSNNRVNESVDINEAGMTPDKIRLLENGIGYIVKRLKSKLKHLDVTTNGSSIVVGNDNMNDDPKLYAILSSRGELRIFQSSHSDHTVKSLTKLSNMAKELADHQAFIKTCLQEAEDLANTIYDA